MCHCLHLEFSNTVPVPLGRKSLSASTLCSKVTSPNTSPSHPRQVLVPGLSSRGSSCLTHILIYHILVSDGFISGSSPRLIIPRGQEPYDAITYFCPFFKWYFIALRTSTRDLTFNKTFRAQYSPVNCKYNVVRHLQVLFIPST